MKFYKYGFQVFNGSYYRYGGHSRWFYKLIDYNIHSLDILFCKWQVAHTCTFYDGVFIHGLYLGFILISWEGNKEELF